MCRPASWFAFVAGKDDGGFPGRREHDKFLLAGVGNGFRIGDSVDCGIDAMNGALVPYDAALTGVMRTHFMPLATGTYAIHITISSAGAKLYAAGLSDIAAFGAV